ncbi:hypothetical protein, partial [Aeromonas media]|uniref:hypothetical protein n=1 Tax=Aeromonas media TaxID=651 RepID=UPI003D00E609
LTALTAEFTVGEGKLMTHDEPCSMAPDDKHDLISGTCSHLPYMNVPSNGYIHRYPVDCWRFYPDSGKALETWGRRCGYGVTLLESFTSAQFSHLQEDRWSDYIAVFAKGDICVNNIQRMSFCSDKTLKNVYTNIHGNQDTDFTPEDFKIQEKYKNQVADIQKRLDLVVQS